MKYLDLPTLARLSTFLDAGVDCGDYIVEGALEAYSCKLAGLDKKLSRSLDRDVQMGSPQQLSASPVGPLTESSSRKTLIYLILALNHVYPDYDFTQLKAHHFRKLEGVARVEETIDSHLLEVSKVWTKTPGCGDSPFLETLWSSIDEAMELKKCDLYSYEPELESDPCGEKASIWSFNYFFYNKALKRVLYMSCRGIPKTSADDGETESSSKYAYNTDTEAEDEDKYGMAGGMDD